MYRHSTPVPASSPTERRILYRHSTPVPASSPTERRILYRDSTTVPAASPDERGILYRAVPRFLHLLRQRGGFCTGTVPRFQQHLRMKGGFCTGQYHGSCIFSNREADSVPAQYHGSYIISDRKADSARPEMSRDSSRLPAASLDERRSLPGSAAPRCGVGQAGQALEARISPGVSLQALVERIVSPGTGHGRVYDAAQRITFSGGDRLCSGLKLRAARSVPPSGGEPGTQAHSQA
ncbi:hypothetical protein NDU88_000262 [Pleurodeles waltl]|uniref:Uncharacterized protein n=1 Tax=Pleurodeles waltl TaxID=8319 RepID=A0AAV7L7L1_PLEWA|nr:hypothetical protein NDU88_000262 [Pleurodeles waltl]